MSASSDKYEHIIPNLKDWPIAQFSANRDEFIQRLIDYVLTKLTNGQKTNLELLDKTIYLEQQRVKINPWKVDPGDEKEYWKGLGKEVAESKLAEDPELEQIKILRRIIHRYCEEIIGHFIPKSHLFARKFLSSIFKRLYNNGWGRGQRWIWGSRKDLLNKIHIRGYVDEIRTLFNKGTVVIVPTHYSNLDSIQIAFGIDQKVGLPAFSYGAGLNLYDVEILAYYMNRLGAYRVDRRKKNPIYLETLKSMASLSLIEGLNHIFFPGGTRSRSGAIEDKLKLGLLNSVIDAQRYCIHNNKNQKIFIVPLSVGYHFVLEAGSLIDQHLRQVGKEKYLRSRKSGSILGTIFHYLGSLRKHESEVYLSFGKPLDVIGNRVDKEGISYDQRDNVVDLSDYFKTGDKTNIDTQRESVYTKILAQKIIEGFKSQNVVLSSHIIAFAAFKILEKEYSDLSLFEILKLPKSERIISKDKLKAKFESVLEYLKQLSMDQNIEFGNSLNNDEIDSFEEGIRYLGIYHNKKPLKLGSRNQLLIEDVKILYYYHNKLVHYDIPKD